MSTQLPEALTSSLSAHLDLSNSRLQTLVGLIVGMINARTVNLTHVAAQFSGTAQTSSSYRRLQRFFQHVHLDPDWLAKAVIALLTIHPPWILCLDRTNWKIGRRDVNILMLAVVKGRMRIPLMWTLLDKAGASNSCERIALMQRYLDLFGAASIRCLLADREFIGPHWICFLLDNKVAFSIRIRDKLDVVLDDGRTYRLKTLLQKAGRKAITTRQGRFAGMPQSSATPLRFCAKRLKDGELLVIVTNGDPNQALRIYKKRWFIECLFADSKTRGLNMEDTRIVNPYKLSTLIAIITLAMIWAYACARTATSNKASPKTKQGYLRKSVFRLGFDLLRKWIFQTPQKAVEVWNAIWPKPRSSLNFRRVV